MKIKEKIQLEKNYVKEGGARKGVNSLLMILQIIEKNGEKHSSYRYQIYFRNGKKML